MSKLLDIASAEIGVKELEGTAHNDRIIAYAREAGFDWYKADETPWCSVFLNWVAHKAGADRSKDARSASWTAVGEKVSEPLPGDVILFGKGGNIGKIYHVGLFMGFSEDGKRLFCLGGNQTNQVKVSKMWRSEVAGYRRIESDGHLWMEEHPEPAAKPKVKKKVKKAEPAKNKPKKEKARPKAAEPEKLQVPRTKLRKGDRGTEVVFLQKALNAAGFNCGPADGIFGEGTDAAVLSLQIAAGTRPNGKMNRRSRKYLCRLLEI